MNWTRKRARATRGTSPELTVLTTRSSDGKTVIVTITQDSGTVRFVVPRGSLDLPSPQEMESVAPSTR